MADYSVKSTQLNPIANAVTPQSGAVDNSSKLLIDTVKGVIAPAVDLYATTKENEFKKEQEGNFRMDLGYTVDVLGNEYAPMTKEEKDLAQTADRVSQLQAMGGTQKAGLALETRLREKIAKEPWLAERYKRATTTVSSEYATTVQLMEAQAAKAVANLTAEQKAEVADIRATQTTLQTAKLVPMNTDGTIINLEDMTPRQRSDWRGRGLAKMSEQAEAEAAMAGRREQRSIDSANRADRAAVRNEGRYADVGQARREKDASKKIVQSRVKTFTEVISRDTSDLARLALTDPEGAKTKWAAGSLALFSRIETALNTPVQLEDGSLFIPDPEDSRKAAESMRATADYYQEWVFGDKSQTAQRAALLESLKTKYGIDIMSNPALAKLTLLPPSLIAGAVADFANTSEASTLRSDVVTVLGGMFSGTSSTENNMNAASAVLQGNFQAVPEANLPAVVGFSVKVLGYPEVAASQPEMFANTLNFNAAQVNYVDANDRIEMYKTTFTPAFAKTLEGLPASFKPAAALNVQKIGRQFLSDTMNSAGGAMQNVAYRDGIFSSTSTDAYSEQLVKNLNSAMFVLNEVNRFAPNKLPNKDAIAKAYFGVQIPEPAPQGSGGNTNIEGGAGKDTLDPNYGNRPDGTPKYTGFLGELKLPDGGVATEYSMQSNAVKDSSGNRIDFPTLVPSLTKEEIDLMVNDIIPNEKHPPEAIIQKAIAHAKKRMAEGKSPFLNAGE